MTSPSYIYRGGEQVFAHPFAAKNVHFFGFIVDADKGKLQSEICDRFLNFAFKTRRFVPATDQVLLVFAHIERIFCRDPPDDVKGVHSEQEAAAWVLMLDTVRREVFWYHPYMVVDSAHAVAMGREIYGFPKAYGWFTAIPDGPARPLNLTVDTVVTEVFRLGEPAVQRRLLEVRRVSPHHAESEDVDFETLEDFTTGLATATAGRFDFILENLIRPRTPMLFLKQFRDGALADRACFQAIGECKTSMTRFAGVRMFGARYEVEIVDYQSHPIRNDLGLPGGIVPVEQAFWWHFDFEIGLSTEMWNSQP